jgi:hypothetical protein
MGAFTTASGVNSAAFGNLTTASGIDSFAQGQASIASGNHSVTMGLDLSAAGDGSVLLGSHAAAVPAADGSFIFADRSTTNVNRSFAPNEFIVRAAGGIGLYTNAALTAGVEMAPGGSSWLALSDVNMKEHFRDIGGEDVLSRIAKMPVREWSYKTQDPSIRHIGPTAQDFRAAFGLGEKTRKRTALGWHQHQLPVVQRERLGIGVVVERVHLCDVLPTGDKHLQQFFSLAFEPVRDPGGRVISGWAADVPR